MKGLTKFASIEKQKLTTHNPQSKNDQLKNTAKQSKRKYIPDSIKNLYKQKPNGTMIYYTSEHLLICKCSHLKWSK